MNRKQHVLEPNKASQRPGYVIFFDCETKPLPISDLEEKHVLKLGWACFIRTDDKKSQRNPQWVPFTTKEEFWEFVESHAKPNRKLYLVAHNVGFDFRIVEGFEYVKQAGWGLSFFYNKGQTCLLTYRRGKTTLQVLDMTNFFPMSLKSVGEAIGVQKQAVDFETVDDASLSIYCKRDVEVMIKAWGVWLAFLDEHDLGNFKHTLPSQAFTAFRHRFMQHKIHIHNNKSICALERAAYRGGRSEVFWKGKRVGGRYYQLDVNSMYSHVMRMWEYPVRFIQSRDGMSVWKLRQMVRHSAVVARVVVKTEEPVFPIHTGTRNVYPVGVFETTLTTPELTYALACDMILSVGQVAWYKKAPIFKEYSTYFADLKERYGRENNAAFRTISKLFGNSLYGKFGQLGMKTTIRKDVPKSQWPYDAIVDVVGFRKPRPHIGQRVLDSLKRQIVTRRWGRSYRLGGDYVIEENGGESYNSFPAIAAHVTAYARIYLWTLIKMAGRKNVYYADTDCLMVNQKGYDNLTPLLDEHVLGLLKVEAQARSLTIHAAKDYVLGDKVRTKGIRKNAQQLAPNIYEQDQFLGLAGAIRKDNPDLVTIKKTRKILSREVKTGVVGPDGWVTPFRVSL